MDRVFEYNILTILQQMIMMPTAYRTSHDFTGQLKGWWDEYLTTEDEDNILNAVKIDVNGEPILQDGDTISDVVAILIFTIAKTLVGDLGIFREKSSELLNNLKCKSRSDFRRYKDIFLTKLYARSDGNKAYWKKSLIAFPNHYET